MESSSNRKENPLMLSILGVGVQVLAAGAAGEASEEELGAAPCWRQLAPTDPPQGMAETLSQAGSAAEKMYLRKGKTARNEEKKV